MDQCNDQNEGLSVCGIDEKQYSSLRKLLRITVYCLKFVKQLIWVLLSIELKKAKEERHKLLTKVLNSISEGVAIHAGDIKLPYSAKRWRRKT